MGRVFRKAFRIWGLGEMKGRWAMEQDFHGDFQVIVTWFSGVLDWIVLILVWSLCTSSQTKLSLTIKTDDLTSARKDVDPPGRLWVVQGQMGSRNCQNLAFSFRLNTDMLRHFMNLEISPEPRKQTALQGKFVLKRRTWKVNLKDLKRASKQVSYAEVLT